MYFIETRQIIPGTLDEIWSFFSDPENLSKITPPEMDFRIISKSGDNMYPGMIITYKVRPLLRLSMTWVTEITYVQEGRYFVDEQRIGPYRLWHHQHHFIKTDEGIKMRDRVDYALPAGMLGRLIHYLFVKKKLEKIFKYRKTRIDELFKS
jgi:ligand-binding SRPBCC domain-containing protein